MSSFFRFFFKPTTGPASIILIRLAVGMVFSGQLTLRISEEYGPGAHPFRALCERVGDHKSRPVIKKEVQMRTPNSIFRLFDTRLAPGGQVGCMER